MDKKQIENLIWHIENNREVAGNKKILDEVLKSLKNNIENNEYKEFEVKIYFKSGMVGYYKCEGISEDDMLLKLANAIKKGATGCLQMKDMEDDKRTAVNIQEIATFGVSPIGDNRNE